MRHEPRFRIARKAMVTLTVGLTAIAGSVALTATPVEAGIFDLTTTTVNCPSTMTYGTTVSCTITVKHTPVFGFMTKYNPTGTVSMGTLLGRLDVGPACTLVAVPATSDKASCSIDVTPNDTGAMLPGAAYSPTGRFVLSVGATTTTVSPAVLTVTADDDSRDYGTANPAFTVQYDGFVNGDDESDLSGAPECTTPATIASVAGDYDIECTAGTLTSPQSWVIPFPAHYTFAFVDGTLTVDPVGLTITADSVSRLVGEANPTFTVSYSGFVAPDDETDLVGTLLCTTAADTSTPVGQHDITCSGLTHDAYDITFVPGTIKILPAPGAKLPDGTVEVTPGESITVNVEGWQPDSTVNVTVCGIVNGTIVVDGDGKGTGVFLLPSELTADECSVVLSGINQTDDPADFTMMVDVASLAPLAPAPPEITPAGSSTGPLVLTALLLMVAGGGFLYAGRRRHHHITH